MEEQLGKAQLEQLYALLDQVIAMEAPLNDEASEEDTE